MIEAVDALREAVLREAMRGLAVPAGAQKTLPPWLFYDERGSALFEEITRLPEYYLTRAERSIFEQFSSEIVSFPRSPITIAELGSGSASKTGLLLARAAARQSELLYQPIDVSEAAIQEASDTLTGIPKLRIQPQVVNYLTDHYSIDRPEGCHVLAMYIGSSIGNFGPQEALAILRKLRKHLKRTSDALLLGVDLAPSAHKSVADLLAAYNDAAGVTAEFNRNILVRLNRELGTNFDPTCFAHRARWNAAESRIEMHLESTVAQTVTLDHTVLAFQAGETIHTENSYKFTERGLRPMLASAGFGSPHLLHDSQHRFAVALVHPG